MGGGRCSFISGVKISALMQAINIFRLMRYKFVMQGRG